MLIFTKKPVPPRRIYGGDLFDVLPELESCSLDACVTDPPYGLEFMGKEWDKLAVDTHGNPLRSGDNPLTTALGQQRGGGDPFIGKGIRYAAGKHSQKWHEAWAEEVWRVLKPGGYLVAFGGTRTFHRLTCALEDAGFEIRDCLMWLYGTGFPKSLNVSKAIDEAAGAEREVIGLNSYAVKRTGHGKEGVLNTRGPGLGGLTSAEVTVPVTDEAKCWEGWGTALKPAWEPIILARKPLGGTVAENVLTHGTGALNIDGCRVESTERVLIQSDRRKGANQTYGDGLGGSLSAGVTDRGRWPANVVLDEEAAAMLDAQSGNLTSGMMKASQVRKESYGKGGYHDGFVTPPTVNGTYGDSGGASRFFYVAKASRSERDLGCNQLPERSGGEATDRVDGTEGLNSPRAGAGRTGGAKNIHPTVKPVSLMRWLVRLVTPPGGIVLDPFLGSGSTAVACMREGRGYVGIERDDTYVEIARHRAAHG